MSVNQPGDVAYGFSQALIGVPSKPILAQRSPTTNDKAQIGTTWINQANNLVFIITSIVDNVATWVQTDSSASINEIETDSGSAFPIMGVIRAFGGANINTAGAGDTVTINLNDNVDLPATNAGGTQGVYQIGGANFLFGYGPTNTFVGGNAGNTTLTAITSVRNVGVGNNAINSLTTGANNTAVGAEALGTASTALNDVAVGYLSLAALTSGESNTALGNQSLQNLVTGDDNIAIGFASGSAYNGAQSSNVLLGNPGNVADSHIMRLGDEGAGPGQIVATFVAAVYPNQGIGPTNNVVFVADNGQMGTFPADDGEIIIGSDTGSPAWSTITPGNNIDITNGANSITIDANVGVITIDGDSGSATGDPITFNANTNCGSTVLFDATGSTVSLKVGNATLHNILIGLGAGNLTATGGHNVGLGESVLLALTTGIRNCALGNSNLLLCSSGSFNTAIGDAALFTLQTGTNNAAVGNLALGLMTSGSFNSALGNTAGALYSAGESSNIVISHDGVAGESHVIHIGTQGSGDGEQNSCFIAGIGGVTPGGTPEFVIIDPTTGELGSVLGTGDIATLDGDTGTASGATVTIAGGSNITTVGNNTSTLTVNLDNNVSISGNYTSTAGNLLLPISDLSFPRGTISCGADTVVHFTSGSSNNGNSFVGQGSGNGTNNGGSNVGVGNVVMPTLTTGNGNTGCGGAALNTLTSGASNTGCGNNALSLMTTGGFNTGIGAGSGIAIRTGSYNCCLGYQAGSGIGNANTSNISIMNTGGAENNVIRIGTQGTGNGQQDSCFIAGIAGVTVANSAAVLIDTTSGEMGTIASSRRYKENISDIDQESQRILELRPVKFNYKNDTSRELHYGLIAEEVEGVFPDLVTYNKDRDPETVRYHEMPALLINEIQRQHAIIADLSRRLERLETRGSYESKA